MSAADVAVRLLGPADLRLIEQAGPDVFDDPVRVARASEFLADPRHHLAAALDRGRLVGFASGVHYVHPDKPPELFVNEVGVSPSHRRRGIGVRLVRALLEHARTLGCRNAWVATEPDNAAARALYAAAGGREDATPFVQVTFELEPAARGTSGTARESGLLRRYDAARDRDGLRACFVELQEVERALEPGMPPGEAVADAYLDLMARRGREFDGEIWVVEDDVVVVGFVNVWTRYRSDEPDDDPGEHAYVSDLVVRSSHRGLGLGRRLLRRAETSAREAGAARIRLSVLTGNTAARRLYEAEGFRALELGLEKSLEP